MAAIERRVRKARDEASTIRYRVRYRDPSGRQRSRSFVRKVDAQAYKSTVEADLVRGEWSDPRLAQIRFGDFARGWLSMKIAAITPKTLEGYEGLLREKILPRFERSPVGRITTLDIKSWVSDLSASGISARRVRLAYGLLRAILNGAVDAEYIQRSPCRGVDNLPKVLESDMQIWTVSEVAAIAGAIPARYRALVYVGAYMGLRWGELAGLRRRSIDFLRDRIEISEALTQAYGEVRFGPTKTHQRGTLTLPSFLRDILEQHLRIFVDASPDALVFTSAHGKPLRHQNFIRRAWAPALKTASLPYAGIHSLRHTCASLLIDQGLHYKDVQAHLRHKTLAVTMDRYGKLFPAHYERVADALEELHDREQDEARGPDVSRLAGTVTSLPREGTYDAP